MSACRLLSCSTKLCASAILPEAVAYSLAPDEVEAEQAACEREGQRCAARLEHIADGAHAARFQCGICERPVRAREIDALAARREGQQGDGLRRLGGPAAERFAAVHEEKRLALVGKQAGQWREGAARHG